MVHSVIANASLLMKGQFDFLYAVKSKMSYLGMCLYISYEKDWVETSDSLRPFSGLYMLPTLHPSPSM